MKLVFLLCLILPAATLDSHLSHTRDWHEVTVGRVGERTILGCRRAKEKGGFAVNWMFRSTNDKQWKLVLSATELKEFSGVASKNSMAMNDPDFQESKDFSLSFIPVEGDEGLYSCLVKRQQRKVKERVILLQLLTVTVIPSMPIPQTSTLQLMAEFEPNFALSQVTWISPGGLTLKSEMESGRTIAKLPWVDITDEGVYICNVISRAYSIDSLFKIAVDIAGLQFSQAALYQTPFIIICPALKGDYVYLYWQPPDTAGRNTMTRLFSYNRWRKANVSNMERVQLAGPPYNAEAGSFSFLLNPDLATGGLYMCEVFLDDKAYRWTTTLSVLKVVVKPAASRLNLYCLYSQRSQVYDVRWEHQNTSYKLEMFAVPGKVQISVPLPINPLTAGNYTCTLVLKNRQTVSATHTVALPPKEGASITTPTLPPFLYALLLLPLVAAAVGVLLWRQKHVSNRGIQRSLSVHSGETENVYENPEDIRQAAPPNSVYMDLKPRAEDVYKELER
ncbi:g6f-like isoform X2 [Synchiropus splendidus]|uniref:g6f-like isoform X2 n=1 Tax=Synchiropus splendidus TaxID=270530 RepID=UPI00237D483B|nr:g6f-like isoform X2 [Synchiropus splendidus]